MDIKLITTDSGYGINLVNGDLQLVDGGLEEVDQRIKNHILIYLNEWYLYRGGIDWVGDVFDLLSAHIFISKR